MRVVDVLSRGCKKKWKCAKIKHTRTLWKALVILLSGKDFYNSYRQRRRNVYLPDCWRIDFGRGFLGNVHVRNLRECSSNWKFMKEKSWQFRSFILMHVLFSHFPWAASRALSSQMVHSNNNDEQSEKHKNINHPTFLKSYKWSGLLFHFCSPVKNVPHVKASLTNCFLCRAEKKMNNKIRRKKITHYHYYHRRHPYGYS